MGKRLSREVIDFAPGENTFGMGLVKEIYDVDGTEKTYFKATLINGVLVVAFTPKAEKIIVIEEFLPTGHNLPSCIGGGLDNGEGPLTAARRELLEETGYNAGELKLLTTITRDSRIDSAMHIVLATGCVLDPSVVPEKGIKVKLQDPAEFAENFFCEMLKDPELPHDGTYTLKGLTLALYELGLMRFD